MAKIMVQGTGSSVGKSLLVTALCRIFKQDGYVVAPYKSQNMSLNSYITLDGKEMGRAQVLQAYAAGLEPQAYMNPILLKPSSDKKAQVIVNGEVYGNSSAMEYHDLKTEFRDMLKRDFEKIEKEFDIVVMEGAGSPAEINLRDKDIVNMGMAELVDAPVILVGDIDKGGVFASLAGTMLLLTDEEKKRVKGTVINKFRGDVDILMPGVKMLEDIVKLPNLGVVPYTRLDLEDEDGTIEFNKEVKGEIDVAVVLLPHVSNFTDVDALKNEENISLRYITKKDEFGNPDLVIIPGSKNTIEDLAYLNKTGIADEIKNHAQEGKYVLGICGGYQMLGKSLEDEKSVESRVDSMEGLGILDIQTKFEEIKVMTRVNGQARGYMNNGKGLFSGFEGSIYGYEIHMGKSSYGENSEPIFKLINQNGEETLDGAMSKDGKVLGSYVHGILDGVEFREFILNKLRAEKGLEAKSAINYEEAREKELDRLAEVVRKTMDIDAIYKMMGIER